jgi:hypothetical protein
MIHLFTLDEEKTHAGHEDRRRSAQLRKYGGDSLMFIGIHVLQ